MRDANASTPRRSSSLRLDFGPPVTVAWSEGEYAAIERRAIAIRRSPNSMIRFLLTYACWGRDADGKEEQLVEGVDAAAAAAHLTRAAWIRIVVLEALEITPISIQARKAAEYLRDHPEHCLEG